MLSWSSDFPLDALPCSGTETPRIQVTDELRRSEWYEVTATAPSFLSATWHAVLLTVSLIFGQPTESQPTTCPAWILLCWAKVKGIPALNSSTSVNVRLIITAVVLLLSAKARQGPKTDSLHVDNLYRPSKWHSLHPVMHVRCTYVHATA